MANSISGLIPTLYEALNRVHREMVGFIPAVTRDSAASQAAVGQTVRSPIGVAGALEDTTPGATPAASGDTTVGYADIVITKSKVAPILWNGEQQKAIGSSGTYNSVLADQFEDGLRKIVNAVEGDLAICAKRAASRAYGTAGTTPFASVGDLSDLAGVAQILDENGAPVGGRQLVVNSAAMNSLRGKQSVLFKVNEAGSNDMLREGMTDRLQGMALRYSGGIGKHAKGTGAGFLVNGTPAAGATSIPVDTGTGTVKAGDIVTFAADAINKYVVGADYVAAEILLNKPGARMAVPDNNAITLGADYTPNFAFNSSAIVLAARAPAVPEGGDSADDAFILADPFSGLSFEVRVYRQYRQVKYEIGLAWGVAAIKPEGIAMLLG